MFAVLEDVLGGVFDEFAADAHVTSTPFPRFTYEQADDLFASDKPDLRNPLRLADVTPVFSRERIFVVCPCGGTGRDGARHWGV